MRAAAPCGAPQNRPFLDRRAGLYYCFFEAYDKDRVVLLIGPRARGFGGQRRGTTRKWRRKFLESLKTDS
jgi:hypothetical protein